MKVVPLVVYILLEHYYTFTAASSAQTPTTSKTSLVLASERHCSAYGKPTYADLSAAQGPSLTGSALSTPYSSRDGGFRCISLALSLRSQKPQDHGLLPIMHSSLAHWNSDRAERGQELCYLERGPEWLGGSMGTIRFLSKAENYESKAATTQEKSTQEEQAADGCGWANSVSWSGSGFSTTTVAATSATVAGSAKLGAFAEHSCAHRSTGICVYTGGAAAQRVCRPAEQVRRRPPAGGPILHSGDQGQGCQEVGEDTSFSRHIYGEIQGRATSCDCSQISDALYMAHLSRGQHHQVPSLWPRFCHPRREFGGKNPGSQESLRAGKREPQCGKGQGQLLGHIGAGGVRRGDRDQRCGPGGSRQDHGEPESPYQQPRRTAFTSCRFGKGGAETQKAKTGGNRVRKAWLWRCCNAIFWLGRCHVTEQYVHQWPLIGQGQFSNTLQWNLSIVDEFNFMSTWTARECAASLAFELGHPGSYPAKPGKPRSPKTVRVGFRDEVRVFLGDADTLRMRSFSFSEPCLANWHAKPWARRPTERSTHAQSLPFWQSFINDVDSVPPIMSCKIIDNHGRPDGFPADGSDHGFPGRDGQGPPPPRIPDFTDNIIAALGHTLTPFGGQPGNFLEIRTWFVDHSQPRQHWASRIISLDGDQATWIQQLREGWNDVLAPDIPTAYQIVHPQPVRGHADMWVSLDIILSHNIHIRRYSGLVTVAFLDDLEGNMHFAVAHSFPRMVSGYLIIDAVDLHHFCSPISPRRCSMLFYLSWLDFHFCERGSETFDAFWTCISDFCSCRLAARSGSSCRGPRSCSC